MDSKSYLTLNSWLQTSDNNYVAGRILWNQMFITQACNLLWLANEQLIKVLLLQKEIVDLSSEEADLVNLHKAIDLAARKYSHELEALVKKLDTEYSELDIVSYVPTLEKLQEYFFRRYVVHRGTSIPLQMIDDVDKIYFLLRAEVLPDVGMGVIDEIYIQRKHGTQHPISSFEWAYKNNKSFRPRRHREINMMINGKVVTECGS